MLKIKKIQDKEEIMVLSQKQKPNNCQIRGRGKEYLGDDCMDDCTKGDMPPWFMSQAC
jgi:hypothetical protein